MSTRESNTGSRVLILDDRPINRQFLTTLLTYKGFETREASDGFEGLEITATWRPDLAIVDIQMPKMDGVEFVRHLHRNPNLASIPVIFYTASYEASEAKRMAQECGVRFVLMKPSEPEVILETVDKALGRLAVRERSAIAEGAAAEFVRLHTAALRTTALVDFQLEIAAQRQPEDVLTLLVRAARTIVPSANAEVTLTAGDGSELRTIRDQDSLSVVIETANKLYGLLLLSGRQSENPYSVEDERMALTIAAEAAVGYENLLLYRELQKEARVLDRNVSLLHSTIEASGDAIVVVDLESHFVIFNQRFIDMWHMTDDIVRAADRQRSMKHALSQVKEGDALEALIRRGHAEPGSELSGIFEMNDGRILECSIVPHRLDGEVIGRVWTSRDITARRLAETELQRVARDRELLLESTGDGIYAVDPDGRCTMINSVGAALLGRTADELIGNRAHALLHHSKADGSPLAPDACFICRPGKSWSVADEVFWRKDGTSFPAQYVSSPLVDDGVLRGAVVTFSDVTEKRRLEKRLEQVSRISSLGRMASTIAHEFNNVLMGIQPFAELIRRRAGEDTKMEQAASQILNSVSRGKSVTQDILRMTRTPEPRLQSIDVTQWLGQLATEIRATAGAIEVVVSSPPPGTLFARFDPNQMQQVITNLANNARDAMAGSGELTLSAARADNAVRIVVADTGCGIPPETVPFIFEPLFTTKHSGTGLGLAVAQQLVLRNGGTIGVESTVGVGTRFQIDLPESMPVVSTLPGQYRLSPQEFGVRRVLIVEDDAAVAAGLSSALEIEDVQVRVVNMGMEAVDVVATFNPDVVLIDVSLPDISGAEVYEQIAAKWPNMAVIFSTGHADESRLPQPASRNVGFLRKPYSTETLLIKLREVV
jgi:PAS domain S-box-containing protein